MPIVAVVVAFERGSHLRQGRRHTRRLAFVPPRCHPRAAQVEGFGWGIFFFSIGPTRVASSTTARSNQPTLTQRVTMAETTLADLQLLLQATAEANKATAEAGQVNASRITDLHTALDKLTLSQGELTTASKRVETSLDRVIQANTALDRSVAELKQSMDAVATRVSNIEKGAPPPLTPGHADLSPGSLQPQGHRIPLMNQGVNFREDRTSGLTLVRGEQSVTRAHDVILSDDDDDPEHHEHGGTRNRHHTGPRLPKSDFPTFNGDNPKWWKKNCEKYFHLYNVQSHLWVDFATMHFKGNAALWLQTYEALHSVASWPELCVGVFTKFNRDKYAKTVDALFAHSQVGSVDEYAHKFEELMHSVLLYNHSYDETFFVRRFIAGLKPHIRSAIKLHNPGTVDLAFSMAQTQEALLVADMAVQPYKYSHRDQLRSEYKQHSQLPGLLGNRPDEKYTSDQPAPQTKFDSLKAQRRARGECFKCGEKYSPTHKCPAQVQLHVLEELLEALQITNSSENVPDSDDSDDDDGKEHVMKLSVHALEGTTSRTSMRLNGLIANQNVLILIDSGSSSNFISQQLTAKLALPTKEMPLAKVSVAGGGTIACFKYIPSVVWYTQGHKFTTDLKVLPLKSYDIILGMDWLENQNDGKMWVNWKKKTMRFKHEGIRITLRGVQPSVDTCTAIDSNTLSTVLHRGEVCQLIELCEITDTPPTNGDSIPSKAPVLALPVNKWRQYLQHAQFTIVTDHRSLSQLKKFISPDQVTSSDLSFDFLTDECFLAQPLQVTPSRSIKPGCLLATNLGIGRSYPSMLSASTCLGQAVFQGGENATTPTAKRRRSATLDGLTPVSYRPASKGPAQHSRPDATST